MDTIQQVFDQVRFQLNDIPGTVYTDDVLLPIAQCVWVDVQERLAENGVSVMVATEELTIPALTTELTSISTPALPDNLIVPWKLWEKPTGTDSTRYIPMHKAIGGLPHVQQTDRLRQWEWETNGLFFIGSTAIVDIKIRYERELPMIDLLPGTGTIDARLLQIRGCGQTVQAGILAGIAQVKVKGDPAKKALPARDYAQEYEDTLDRLVNRNMRPEQQKSHRRQPYGFRRHFGGHRRY